MPDLPNLPDYTAAELSALNAALQAEFQRRAIPDRLAELFDACDVDQRQALAAEAQRLADRPEPAEVPAPDRTQRR